MKLLILILVIINVVFGVYVWQSESRRGSSPAALPLPELAPERIRLLAAQDLQRQASKPKPPAEAGSVRDTTDATSLPARVPSREEIAKASAIRACTEWGGFRGVDVARATKLIEDGNLTARPIEERIEGGTGYWVYIPPLPSRRHAELRIAELKPARIDDYYVMLEDGRFANAISLGVFSTEAGAQSRREALARLGVNDAIVGRRESIDARVFLRVRDVPEQSVPRLLALRGEFAGTEIKDCASDPARGG
ncbi:MAG: SPOR domain-containing protein [Burkholderiales bacterium]